MSRDLIFCNAPYSLITTEFNFCQLPATLEPGRNPLADNRGRYSKKKPRHSHHDKKPQEGDRGVYTSES